jgi:hypothetical protein
MFCEVKVRVGRSTLALGDKARVPVSDCRSSKRCRPGSATAGTGDRCLALQECAGMNPRQGLASGLLWLPGRPSRTGIRNAVNSGWPCSATTQRGVPSSTPTPY